MYCQDFQYFKKNPFLKVKTAQRRDAMGIILNSSCSEALDSVK